MWKLITKNPVRTMAVITALLAAAAPYLPATLIAGLTGVLAAVLGVGVHSVVTPVTTMVENVTTAATNAATQTVEALGKTTVGTVGEVTDAAKDIILTTVDKVVGGILK